MDAQFLTRKAVATVTICGREEEEGASE